jgi:hypothetical protein
MKNKVKKPEVARKETERSQIGSISSIIGMLNKDRKILKQKGILKCHSKASSRANSSRRV